MSLPSIYRQGRYYYASIKGRNTYLGNELEKAKQKLLRIVSNTDRKAEPRSAKYTISQARDIYLTYVSGSQSDDTIYQKRKATGYLLEKFGDVPIDTLTVDMLEEWKRLLLERMQKSSVQALLLRCSSMFQHFVNTGFLRQNHFRRLLKLKLFRDPNPDTLTDDEFKTLLDLAAKRNRVASRDALVFHLIRYAGLRRIEISNLKWSDIDLERRKLVVRNGKGGKHRVIPINDVLLQQLAARTPATTEYVVCNRYGTKIARSTLTRLTTRYRAALDHHYKGTRRFSLHSLRATFASTLARNGVNPFCIQRLMGHADLVTTMHYCSVNEEEMLRAVEGIG